MVLAIKTNQMKLLLALIASGLLVTGCAQTEGVQQGSALQSIKTSQQITKTPVQEFLQILIAKDAGQVEFNQFVNAHKESKDSRQLAEKKYQELISKSLQDLKSIHPRDPEVKRYIDSLLQLSRILEEGREKQAAIQKNYAQTHKVSKNQQQELADISNRALASYIEAMRVEMALTNRFAAHTTGVLQDFLKTQVLLNNDLLAVTRAEQQLLNDKTIKSERAFARKAAPLSLTVAQESQKAAKAVSSQDNDIQQYIIGLRQYYGFKTQLANLKIKAVKQGKLSPSEVRDAKTALLNLQRFEESTSKQRLQLLERFAH